MANVSELYASPWLTADDLKGASHTLVIVGAEIKPFKNQETQLDEPKVVLSFATPQGTRARKQLIVNKSQYKSLAALTGSPETDNWLNREVMLSPVPANNGKFTIAISGTAQPVQAGATAF